MTPPSNVWHNVVTENLQPCLQRAVPVPGDARDDWKIVRAVSEILGKALPYDSLEVHFVLCAAIKFQFHLMFCLPQHICMYPHSLPSVFLVS